MVIGWLAGYHTGNMGITNAKNDRFPGISPGIGSKKDRFPGIRVYAGSNSRHFQGIKTYARVRVYD
jgi:hypothetical protein